MTDSEQTKIFASNLSYYVNRSNKLQKEIAKDLGIPYQTFNGWCKGVSFPSMDKVQKIADYFRIGKSDLIERFSRPNTPPVSSHEFECLQKIRMLDDAGRSLVMTVINHEYERCVKSDKSQEAG